MKKLQKKRNYKASQALGIKKPASKNHTKGI